MSVLSSIRVPVIDGATGAALMRATDEVRDAIVELAIDIATIPAPTGSEQDRASFIAELMPQLGFTEVNVDELNNVVGLLPGRSRDRPLLIAAHTDTVFPAATLIEIHREGDIIAGPGIGDNSVGLAAALYVPRILALAGVTPGADLLVTGNVGEEGLGNLRGMIALMDAYPEVGAVIAVEGHNLGRVTHVAVGSKRYRVAVSGPGGHSWGDAGNASAIHAAADLVARLAAIPLPSSPKTTLNIGSFTGGISVNTIAPSASFLLDLRSVDGMALTALGGTVESMLAGDFAGVDMEWELIGERPAGSVPPDSRMVRVASSILESLGLRPTGDASSTDANIAIDRNVPALCIGITTGGNVHREDEFINCGPIGLGVYQLAALTTVVAEDLRTRRM